MPDYETTSAGAKKADESAKEVEATTKEITKTVGAADDDGNINNNKHQHQHQQDEGCEDHSDRFQETPQTTPEPTPELPTSSAAAPSRIAQNQESTLQKQQQQLQPIKIPTKYGESLSPSDGKGELIHKNNCERKGSNVSFHTTCDLYEIDLDNLEKKPAKLKPLVFNSVRYYVMLLALISPFVTTYSRTIINFAITDMIDPECVESKSGSQTTTTMAPTTIGPSSSSNPDEVFPNCSVAYFDVDNSCPVDDRDRGRLIEGNRKDIERARTSIGEKFKWDTWYQGLLKSAYAVGHAPFQIPGSRLSERYGSHWVMTISSSIIALLCLLAPFLAAIHFWLLYLDLFMLGVLGSFMTPALITLFSNWLTPGEKTITLSFYLIASRLGYALSSILCGLLISMQLSWRYVFFSAGFISIAFSALFIVFARSRPQDHPLVSQEELEYLATKNTLVRESLARRRAREELAKHGEKAKQQFEMKLTNNGLPVDSSADQVSPPPPEKEQQQQQSGRGNKHQAPWFAILTNVPVWAFIITKFCVKLAGDTVQIELPTYLNRVMHYDPKENGKINAWMYVIFCVGCLVVGALAKSISKSKPFGLSKTAIRKIFQSVASFGVSVAIMGLAFSVCNKSSTEFYLMLIFFVTTFGTGGEAQIPLDISERYAGTIHAMGSSLAISSAIEPMLVGFLMRGHAADKESWKNVWLGAGSIASFGGLVFLFFADAKIQPFDHIGTEQNKTDVEKGEPVKGKPESMDNNNPDRDDNNNDNNNNSKDDDVLMEKKAAGLDNKAFVRDIGNTLGGDQQKACYRESIEI